MADPREWFISALLVTERTVDLDGIRSAVLEGGRGEPVVILHGPAEFGARWYRAIRLSNAENARARYGWPLHVIEDAADDAPLERPEAFLRTLWEVLEPIPADRGTTMKGAG